MFSTFLPQTYMYAHVRIKDSFLRNQNVTFTFVRFRTNICCTCIFLYNEFKYKHVRVQDIFVQNEYVRVYFVDSYQHFMCTFLYLHV